MRRKIIKIDEKKCNGCGLCIPNCPEGALQIIDGKARLISDLFCDGLGACIGHCPEGAITIEEREAERYDEKKVIKNIASQGKNVIKAHLEHLKEHGQDDYLREAIDFLKEKNIEIPVPFCDLTARPKVEEGATAFSGCPGARMVDFRHREGDDTGSKPASEMESQLRQWPIQIMLVPPSAPFLKDSDLLIAADCVPFAYANFHNELLRNKVLLVGCPKLDDVKFYREKLTRVFSQNKIKSITVAHMEVPCCFGLVRLVEDAIKASKRDIPFYKVEISIKGDKK